MNSPHALYPAVDSWEFAGIPGGGQDLTVDPEDATKPIGSARGFEVVDGGGDVQFVMTSGRTVLYTNVAAGRAYSAMVSKILQAPGRVRVFW